MKRDEFNKPYIVALYREHRRDRDAVVSVNELLVKYDLPRDSYLDDEVTEYLQMHGWAQPLGARAFGEGPSDQSLEISGNGKIAAEAFIEAGIDPKPIGPELGTEGTASFTALSEAIPASDRVVSLNDNEIASIQVGISELIEAVRATNDVPDDETFKPRIMGELSAGNELIKSGFVRVYLMEQTILTTVGELIARYKDAIIGNLATDLLKLLVVAMAIMPH